MKALLIFCLSQFLALASSGQNISDTQKSEAAQQMDGFHYTDSLAIGRDMLYSQMWYFNFIDDKNGIAGVIGGGVLDPEQRVLPIGQTSAIVAVLRNDGDSFYSWSPHYNPKDSFSASATFAPDSGVQFKNPAMSIKVLSPDVDEVKVTVQDGNRTTSMDLIYTRAAQGLGDGWIPWNNVKLPRLFGLIGGRATYTMPMPDALVSGTVEIKEGTAYKKYVVENARGYHDGYYGSATLIPGFKWDWMSFQQDDLAIELIDPHGPVYKCGFSPIVCTPGNLRVTAITPDGGVSNVTFTRPQIAIHYDDMKIDPEFPQVPYPDRETITATDNRGNGLAVQWDLVNYLKVFYHPPPPMKDLPTYEMVAHLHGTFHDARTGRDIPVDGRGWVDYSNNP